MTETRSAVLWQGFHHAWGYNHRLNRFGSYVRTGSDGAQAAVIGHTAASGTGGDVAHVAELVTRIHSSSAGFQGGSGEAVVECPRAVTTTFRIPVRALELSPALAGRDTYTVLLNGFDLMADRHADKLIAFDLEVTEPIVYAGGTRIRFDVLGQLRFDCRTAECQLWPFSLGVERVDGRRERPGAPPPPPPDRPKRGIRNRPALEQGVQWLKRQVARITDLENVKRGIVGRDEDRLRRQLFRLFGRQFVLRLRKWRIITPYTLRVHYLIIGGDRDGLRVTDSEPFENAYGWDAETEIHGDQLGRLRVAVAGGDPAAYALNTFGFKGLSLSTELDPAFGSSNLIQWGTGMHMLAWDAAVRDIEPRGDRVTGTLDLFYKSWSEAMNEVITLTTWGAVRSAGSARLGARLALLQFKGPASGEQMLLPGRIHWPGGGRSARDDPRALLERSVEGQKDGDYGA